jgi:hypothetical protein
MHPKQYAELELSSGGVPSGTLLTPLRRAFAVIGVGNTKGYELIAEGKLVARKLGSRTMIETESLRAYVASLPRVPTKAA